MNASKLFGSFDGVIGRLTFGWVFDPVAQTRSVRVELFDLATSGVLGAGWANQPRDDLRRLGIGAGRCAFRIVLPEYPAEWPAVRRRLGVC